jgi:hypothetical protein
VFTLPSLPLGYDEPLGKLDRIKSTQVSQGAQLSGGVGGFSVAYNHSKLNTMMTEVPVRLELILVRHVDLLYSFSVVGCTKLGGISST